MNVDSKYTISFYKLSIEADSLACEVRLANDAQLANLSCPSGSSTTYKYFQFMGLQNTKLKVQIVLDQIG